MRRGKARNDEEGRARLLEGDPSYGAELRSGGGVSEARLWVIRARSGKEG